MAEGKNLSFEWMEAKAYTDMACCERCVYGIVSQGSVIGVWLSAGLNGPAKQLSQADESLASTALAIGLRLFVACPSVQQWEQIAEMNGELRADLQRHVETLVRAAPR